MQDLIQITLQRYFFPPPICLHTRNSDDKCAYMEIRRHLCESVQAIKGCLKPPNWWIIDVCNVLSMSLHNQAACGTLRAPCILFFTRAGTFVMRPLWRSQRQKNIIERQSRNESGTTVWTMAVSVSQGNPIMGFYFLLFLSGDTDPPIKIKSCRKPNPVSY